MVDAYFAEFLIALGAIILTAGFYRMGLARLGPRRTDGPVVSDGKSSPPPWGFAAMGIVMMVAGSAMLAVR